MCAYAHKKISELYKHRKTWTFLEENILKNGPALTCHAHFLCFPCEVCLLLISKLADESGKFNAMLFYSPIIIFLSSYILFEQKHYASSTSLVTRTAQNIAKNNWEKKKILFFPFHPHGKKKKESDRINHSSWDTIDNCNQYYKCSGCLVICLPGSQSDNDS